MLTFFNEYHVQHAAAAMAAAPVDAIAAEFGRRGLGRIVTPHGVPLTSLERVHTPRYLHFLRSAWSQRPAPDKDAGDAAEAAPDASLHAAPPTPLLASVWPGPGQRRDVEPEDFAARLGLYATDGATALSAGTWTAAKTGADCAVNAAHALRLGERGTFALTSPPGHHAGAESFGGGCFLNNAALAAQHLLDDGLERVAILDVDRHHGSGTQDIFYARRDVLCISIHLDPRHAYPFYAGHADETGAGEGRGCNMNLPLAPGAPATAWLAALETACLKMSTFAPQALVVALGAGEANGDARASFGLAGADYLRLGERLGYLELSTVFVLEGAAAEGATGALAVNLVNVLEGFETAS